MGQCLGGLGNREDDVGKAWPSQMRQLCRYPEDAVSSFDEVKKSENPGRQRISRDGEYHSGAGIQGENWPLWKHMGLGRREGDGMRFGESVGVE